MTQTKTETDTWPEETWTYAGIRELKGKRAHCWRDPSRRELLYSDKGSYVIGGLYSCRVNRESESLTRTHPQYTGERLDREERGPLDAADLAARVRLASLAQERKHAAESALDDATEPLVQIARTLRTGADRDALAAYIIRRIGTAW
jgi:hypothetical protein